MTIHQWFYTRDDVTLQFSKVQRRRSMERRYLNGDRWPFEYKRLSRRQIALINFQMSSSGSDTLNRFDTFNKNQVVVVLNPIIQDGRHTGQK